MTTVINGTHRADVHNPDIDHLTVTMHGGTEIPVTIELSLAEARLLLAALLAHGIATLR